MPHPPLPLGWGRIAGLVEAGDARAPVTRLYEFEQIDAEVPRAGVEGAPVLVVDD